MTPADSIQGLWLKLSWSEGASSGASADAMCRGYLSFVTNTAGKTFGDYFALFRRQALVDVALVLAVLRSVLVLGVDDLIGVLGVCVVFIWLCDAALVLHFSSRVREACAGNSISQDHMDGLIQRKRILVAVSLLGLIVYVARFCVELSVISALGRLDAIYLPTALVLVVVVIKVVRLLALNSFSNWVRLRAQRLSASTSAPSV